ncbi:MAG: iron donor protein CyaY [Chloroherpetonaceae bacterium]|nr:iron donor protein CyaY [Chloroherpetonaceae bacterium]MCS7210178.1 iron donor protein CyaY [Chloroherpetonaceae bacterium]MDW8019899.1 iron donor protein CyaY [Chloroherpetonaceae bacterium]MDW8467090.1 iron donor protein CyaY [Chloroherpetonaceae bacterium]
MAEPNLPIEIEKELQRLFNAIDALGLDDVEIELADGKLVIEFEDGTKFIVNRQSATNQIWLAEPQGGWRFDWKDGRWLDDKRGIELSAALADLMQAKLGQPISLK